MGEEVVVVRKGATPLSPGQLGFVGGSMGDISVIVEGIESEENTESFRKDGSRRRAGNEPYTGDR